VFGIQKEETLKTSGTSGCWLVMSEKGKLRLSAEGEKRLNLFVF